VDLGAVKLRPTTPNTNASKTTTTTTTTTTGPPPPQAWGGFDQANQAFLWAVWTDYRNRRISDWEQVAERFRTSDVKQPPPPQSADAFVSDVRRLKLRIKGIVGDESIKTGGYPVSTEMGSVNSAIAIRVYVNALVRFAPTVFEYVQNTIEAPRRVTASRQSGVVFSKLGSHQITSTSRDVIVIYTSDDQATGEVLDELRRYQSTDQNRNHFADEVVRMTNPVQGLRGVGVGVDPPTYLDLKRLARKYRDSQSGDWRATHNEEPFNVNFSFSQYRSALIFLAMENAARSADNDQARGVAFPGMVAEHFRTGGLDPANPGRQGPVDESVIRLFEGMFYDKKSS
jgi:hypothetical protein